MSNQVRKTPLTTGEIRDGIERVKWHAADDLKAIHLLLCDFNEVWLNPGDFNVTKQRDGRLKTVFRGRLIPLIAVR